MDDSLPLLVGVLVGALASGSFGVLRGWAKRATSERMWASHGEVEPSEALLLSYLDVLGEATIADLALAARLPPDRVAKLIPSLVSAGWAKVTDQESPLPLVAVTGHGSRTAATLSADPFLREQPRSRWLGKTPSHEDVTDLSARLDAVLADLQR